MHEHSNNNKGNTAIITYKSKWKILIYVISISLGAIYEGYQLTIIDECADIISSQEQISNKNILQLTCILPIGAIFGAFGTGVLASSLGRRKSIILVDFLSINGILLSIYSQANHVVGFGLGRFFCGLTVGLNSVLVPLYIYEISPTQIRTAMLSIVQIMLVIGISISYSMHTIIRELTARPLLDVNWKILFCISLIPCAIRLLVFLFLLKFETPKFHMMMGERDKALQILRKIYKENQVPLVLRQLDFIIRDESDHLGGPKYRDMFTQRWKDRIISGTGISIVQQLSGFNAVILFKNLIYRSGNIAGSILNKDLYANFLSCSLLAMAVISLFIVDKIGRKKLLLLGDALMIFTLALIIMGIFESIDYLVDGLLMFYLMTYGFTLGPIVIIYLTEILPEKGLSICIGFNWICCSIITLIFPLTDDIKNYVADDFVIFLIFNISGFFFIVIYGRETKKKNYIQIKKKFEYEDEDEHFSEIIQKDAPIFQ